MLIDLAIAIGLITYHVYDTLNVKAEFDAETPDDTFKRYYRELRNARY